MKTILFAATFIAATIFSVPSHALVILVRQCQVSNGAYRLLVLNNEGIGFNRIPSYSAEIYNDQDQVVGFYQLKVLQHIHSISFGRKEFVDVQTEGKIFDLALPSTNCKNTILKATLSDGTVISDDNLKCDN